MVIQAAMRDGRNDIAFTIGRDDLQKAVEAIGKLVEEIEPQECLTGMMLRYP